MSHDDTSGGSQNSLLEATRARTSFSGHGKSLGAAGYIDPNDQDMNADFLGRRDDNLSVSPPEGGFGDIRIGAAWDNQVGTRIRHFSGNYWAASPSRLISTLILAFCMNLKTVNAGRFRLSEI